MANRDPSLKGLVQHTQGLPDWWTLFGNVLWAPANAALPEFRCPSGRSRASDARVILRPDKTQIHHITLWGVGCRIEVGHDSTIQDGVICCVDAGTVVIGAHTHIAYNSWIDARNGGSIRIGDDGLWSSGVRVATDDMHAIVDLDTRKRINKRGSHIEIGDHVWLGLDVIVLPGAQIGRNSVIGARSLVSKTIPENVVAAGIPARVIRQGVTWSHEDLASDWVAPPKSGLERFWPFGSR